MGGIKFCENCGAKIIEKARFCEECGHPIPDEKSLSGEEKTIMWQPIICPKCGMLVKPEENTCVTCGMVVITNDKVVGQPTGGRNEIMQQNEARGVSSQVKNITDRNQVRRQNNNKRSPLVWIIPIVIMFFLLLVGGAATIFYFFFFSDSKLDLTPTEERGMIPVESNAISEGSSSKTSVLDEQVVGMKQSYEKSDVEKEYEDALQRYIKAQNGGKEEIEKAREEFMSALLKLKNARSMRK